MELSFETVPAKELQWRIENLQYGLREKGCHGAIIVQRADLYYFSGTGQNAHLLVPAEGEPLLLVRKNYQRARRESRLNQVIPLEYRDQLADEARNLFSPHGKLGMELDVIPAKQFFRYQKMLDRWEIADLSSTIRHLRAVKSSWELKRQAEAAEMARALFNYARNIIREGMTEIELASELEAFVRKRGHQGVLRMRSFNQEVHYGHIMSGSSAAIPSFFDGATGGPGLNPSFPQGAGTKFINKNEPVLIDFMTVSHGYMVDQTRIFSLGPLSSPLEKAYQTSLEINNELANLGRSGILAEDLYHQAEKMATIAGLSDNFMGAEEKVNFVGHGVGLEVDELPVIAPGMDIPLKEGMVFALEPKFIFPNQGTVGIEDTFVVRQNRLEPLTTYDDALQYL